MTETCHRCGENIPPPEEGSCSTGYGVDAMGHSICYSCCAKEDITFLLKREPTLVYLSSDMTRVTNWPGSTLGKVDSHSVVAHPWGVTIYHVRITDVHGAKWFGRGRPGMVLTIRPMKGKV